LKSYAHPQIALTNLGSFDFEVPVRDTAVEQAQKLVTIVVLNHP
jgi:hypothetical protein